mmetsp:Transcript_18889/g.62335  ORF Transcript_18889/g.62335 Transcript_18889/m.62335 type:complete len:355 (+) Transcript_18889:71-1135(+)
MAFLALPVAAAGLAAVTTPLLPAGATAAIERGQIHVEPGFLPPPLVRSLREDAMSLFEAGLFSPDGLTNTAVGRNQQGFDRRDRQTFRGDGWSSATGDQAARLQFAARMRSLREELAEGLGRPTLASEGERRHEMTYNWYEAGAKLGRHLDEHHEETKGTKGWLRPSRRSVTWLVYLNEQWEAAEGGALRTFPRPQPSSQAVGSDAGNLQVGWLDASRPVFLETREGGLSTLYCRAGGGGGGGRREALSAAAFEVPRQPVDFGAFLAAEYGSRFEQISTSRLDPRFATGTPAEFTEFGELHHVDVLPAAGTLVLFDSVSLPHLVREVTSTRPRVAATGWFHEDSLAVPLFPAGS